MRWRVGEKDKEEGNESLSAEMGPWMTNPGVVFVADPVPGTESHKSITGPFLGEPRQWKAEMAAISQLPRGSPFIKPLQNDFLNKSAAHSISCNGKYYYCLSPVFWF